ncbi:hypothetical protein OIT44_03005 [Weissella ceti]|uniref:Uncharacterized protein n=1 Tax=Weissella ceti TaxID=759620 RepID=A0ABT3E3P7_9LACO|nr:hypothetical protein [Weissella ceti]MCW0953041.1 hypothetical protein [Weissella ceti]QVK11586.1 hypothetical protein KHQ31_05015 [Weissella ceti]
MSTKVKYGIASLAILSIIGLGITYATVNRPNIEEPKKSEKVSSKKPSAKAETKKSEQLSSQAIQEQTVVIDEPVQEQNTTTEELPKSDLATHLETNTTTPARDNFDSGMSELDALEATFQTSPNLMSSGEIQRMYQLQREAGKPVTPMRY